MDTEKLKKFLVAANQAGYAAEDTRKWIEETNGSLTIAYTENDLAYQDNFFGGDPFGGRIIVSENGKPKWIMVYYGKVNADVEANKVFQFLRAALKKVPQDIPLRGPSSFKEANQEYINRWNGDLANYSGNEVIMEAGVRIYECTYLGGWVDSRSAL